MTGAYFNGERTAVADRGSGYSPQANGWRLVAEGSGYAGNGGMISSVRDLLLWANNFSEARVGTPALLTRMQTATTLTTGQTTQSGIGFGIGTYRGARTFRTSGGFAGTATELVLFPDQKTAVAVLCNMDSVVMGGLATVNPDDLTNGVADVFLADVLEPRPTPAATASATPPAPVNVSADELASKTGLYRMGPDENQIVLMSVRDGKLTAWDFWGDNYPLLLTPIGPNRFTVAGLTIEFSPAQAGRPQSWHITDGEGRRMMELPSVRFEASKADLPSFAGEYQSDELDGTYTVAMRDGDLVLESSVLHAVSKDAFVGSYMGTVRFFRNARGAVEGFTLNRAAARGVRFERVKRAE